MQLWKSVTLFFTGDDTSSTLAVDLLAAPTNLSGTPSGLLSGTNLVEYDPQFRVVTPPSSPTSYVPAAPSMSDCTLAGTVLTATFSDALPATTWDGYPAQYSLTVTLTYQV